MLINYVFYARKQDMNFGAEKHHYDHFEYLDMNIGL